jgi:hypothetical protein
MQTKLKSNRTQIRDPVILDDGSMVFDVTLTTNQPDRDGDIINPLGVTGIETAVIAYNHQKCNGIPVSTGASIVKDSIVQNLNELRMQIKVDKTNEMFFCDLQGIKRSNGKLLDAIMNNQANNISMGFRFNPSTVQIKYVNSVKYSYYPEIILDEFSILDVLSSNPNSVIHKTPNIMPDELTKQKCLDCLRNAGTQTFAINPSGLVAKITEITDTEIKGKDFDGNEIIFDDSFEPVEYAEIEAEAQTSMELAKEPTDIQKQVEELTKQLADLETQKACGCQLNKKEEKAGENILPVPTGQPMPEIVDSEDAGESVMLQMILDNQATIIANQEEIKQLIESTKTVEPTTAPSPTTDTIKSQVDEAVKMSMTKFMQLPKTEIKQTQTKLNLF